MCKCTPNKRTPFCGAVGCEWPEKKVEKILHAAMLLDRDSNFFLIGKSHSDCYQQGKNMNISVSSRFSAQGFVTSLGRFVKRPEAAKIAYVSGQVPYNRGALISEDLWLDNGFSYDYVKGYFKDDKT